MDGGICLGTSMHGRSHRFWLAIMSLGLFPAPAQFSHRAGYKRYSLVIHGPHLGCALLHARAKLPFAKGEIPFLENASAATEGIKAAVSTETLNTG